MTFSDSDATRIIAALEARAEKKTRNGAQVQTTWGTVGAVDTAQKYASAYLYGETDGAYMSEGFRIPETMYLTVGDRVKVAINYATGERWVAEKNISSAYKKIVIDTDGGSITFGDGASAPAMTLYNNSGRLSTNSPFYAKSLSGSGYATNSTSSGDANKWTKIASGSISVQYGENTFELFLGGAGSGSTAWTRGILRMRVKQQVAFGGEPYVVLELVDGGSIAGTDFSVVVTSNAGPTTWELYARLPNTYSTLYFQPLFYVNSGGGPINFHEAQSWSTTLPAGTVYAGDANSVAASEVTFGTDVNLYRGAANTLTTDDAFYVNHSSGVITVGSGNTIIRNLLVASDTYPNWRVLHTNGVIDWGAGGASAPDTNLYRSAANTLKTDDKFDPASLNVQVKAGAPADGDIVGGAASGDMVLDTTNSRIYFRVGTTWKSVLLA